MSIIEQSAGGIIMPVRRPAAAGMFYSSSASELRAEVEGCFADPPAASLTGPRKIAGLVSPHAGYIYSGRVAALAYHRLAEDGLPDIDLPERHRLPPRAKQHHKTDAGHSH